MRHILLSALAFACLAISSEAQEQTAPTPPAAPAGATSATTAATPEAHQPTTGAYWVSRPTAADFDRYYPVHARRHGLGGRALLDCLVIDGGTINCTVAAEDPPGEGFGEAALNMSHAFRMAPTTTDGRSTVGGRIRVPITFWMR